MTARLPFNKRDRHRAAQSGLGHRPTNNWGSGDLPAPWAEGDIVDVPTDAPVLVDGRRWWKAGFAVITAVFSIGERDDWYVRLCAMDGQNGSDRLHIIPADDVDWMAGVRLIDTADPAGLELRARMLANGWTSGAPAAWTIRDEGARPLTVNAVAGLHRQQWATHTRETRGRWHYLALEAKVRRVDAVTVTVLPLHRDRRSPQDVAACAPEAKAAIDGLVDAGLIPDDSPTHLRAVTFLPPQVCGVNGLQLTIEEVA